jgi:hypothetical protein
MSARTTIVLVLLVAAGLAYLLFVEDILDLGTTDERADRDRRALDIDVADVVAFRLEREGTTAVLERDEDDRWRLVEPVRAPADERAVERLLHALEGHLRKLGSERVPRGELAAFGLDPPSIRVELRTRARTESLSVGGETPAGGRRWVRIGDSDDVLVVEGGIHAALDRTVFELRDRDVFHTAPYRVDRIEVRGPEGRLVAVRTDDGWRLDEPIRDLADRTRVEEILYRLAESEVADFVDPSSVSPAEAGLEAPKRTVTIVGETGAAETLEIGGPAPGRPARVYARKGNGVGFVALDASILETVDLSPNALRERSLWPPPFPSWTWIEIAEGVHKLRVEASEGGYRVTYPEDHPADREKVDLFVEALRTATVRRFVADADRAAFGLDPGLEIRLGEADRAIGSIRLGRLDEEERFVFASWVDGDRPVLAVDRALLDRVPRTVLDLRSRDIVAIDLWQAETVRLERPDRTYVAREDGFTLRIEEPRDGSIDPEVASRLEEMLRPLRAVRLVEDAASEEDLAERGLAPPTMRLAVRYEDDADREPVALRFGNPVPGGGRFAVVEGDRLVFSTSPELDRILGMEWLDRRILGDVRPSDVSRIRLERGGERLHLIRRGEVWEAKDPEGADIDPRAVARLLDTLLGPVVDRYLLEAPPPALGGLDDPSATISIDVEQDGSVESRTLRFGSSREGGGRFAKLEGRDGIFLVSDEVYDRLRVPR